MIKKIIYSIYLILLFQQSSNAQTIFHASPITGSVNCRILQGDYIVPVWWGRDPLWRVGRPLILSFNIPSETLDEIENYIEIRVKHTGSWGKGELTKGEIIINNHVIVSDYIPPNQLEEPSRFNIKKRYLKIGKNILKLTLTKESKYVWWIRSIEASY